MSAIPYPEDDPELEVVEPVLNQIRGILGEHFDCGVVLLTKDTNGITSYHSTEFGNKFAIRGMVDGYVNGEFDSSELEE